MNIENILAESHANRSTVSITVDHAGLVEWATGLFLAEGGRWMKLPCGGSRVQSKRRNGWQVEITVSN